MYLLIVLLPLISAVTAGFFGRLIYSVMTENVFCHSLYININDFLIMDESILSNSIIMLFNLFCIFIHNGHSI